MSGRKKRPRRRVDGELRALGHQPEGLTPWQKALVLKGLRNLRSWEQRQR